MSWASCDAAVEQQPGAAAPARAATAGVSSIVQYGTSKDSLHQTAEGVATSYVSDYSSVGGVSYASPLLHHVLLKGECGGGDGGCVLRVCVLRRVLLDGLVASVSTCHSLSVVDTRLLRSSCPVSCCA